jgi:hypothetical protein
MLLCMLHSQTLNTSHQLHAHRCSAVPASDCTQIAEATAATTTATAGLHVSRLLYKV